MTSGDSKGGPGWAMPFQIFAWTPFGPPSFFLNFPFRFVWLTYAGCPMRFVKTPVILSTAPDLSCVVIRKRHRDNRDNQYYLATINNLPVF